VNRIVRYSITIILLLNCAAAQNINKTGTTAADFLKIGVGARAVGMGGAFVAIADDATSMYWNPGGLAQLNKTELIVNHSKWIADIGFTYFGFVIPIPRTGIVGFNVTAMTMDEMEVTTYGNENGTGQTFGAGSYAVGISFARKLTDQFSIGANIKYISEFISETSAGGLAMDIGTMFVTPFRDIRFGASISNFGQKMQMLGDDLLVQKDIDDFHHGNNESVNAYLATDEFDLPLLLRVGLSGEVINSPQLRLTWAIDGNHPNDNTEYLNLGFEIGMLNNMIMVRSGLKSLYMEDGEEQFALGAGLNLPLQAGMRVQADYAFESFVHLKPIHKFTIRLVL